MDGYVILESRIMYTQRKSGLLIMGTGIPHFILCKRKGNIDMLTAHLYSSQLERCDFSLSRKLWH